MKIIVDGFGGDNAPLAVIEGCAQAVEAYGVDIVLVGDEQKLEKVFEETGISKERVTIAHAPGVISMEDDPNKIVRDKSDVSMAVGLRMLKEGQGDAFVSAGNTGALVMASSTIVRRIKGIKRAALATQVPTRTGSYMLLDVGANVECRPEMLAQFGIMGSAYIQGLFDKQNPTVGLINIGTEEKKGPPLVTDAFAILKKAPVNFVGNVEARELNNGVCDVAVCDGFTGNIILKLTEGLAKTMMGMIKDALMGTTMGKVGGALIKPSLKSLMGKLDYTEYGGAPLLGLAKPVIKAHGSSDANAFKNAIRQAKIFYEEDVIGKTEAGVAQLKGIDIGDGEA